MALSDSDPREPSVGGPGVDFDRLYERDYHAVVALAFGLSGSRAAAEELAQDAFLALLRSWDKVSGYSDPAAWVRRVVINHSVSGFRRRAAELRALSRLAGRRQLPAELPQPAAEFWEMVRRLPRRQAQVVALYYFEDRSVDDIAEILGCAAPTVKVHLHRARAALAQSLGESSEETR